MGRANSSWILRYFGLNQKTLILLETCSVVFFTAFLAPWWSVLRDSTWGLFVSSRRTTFMFWSWRDSAFLWVNFAIYRGWTFCPEVGARRGRRPRVSQSFANRVLPPAFSKYLQSGPARGGQRGKVQIGPSVRLSGRMVRFGPPNCGWLQNHVPEFLFASNSPRNCIFLLFCTKTKNISKYANSWYFSIQNICKKIAKFRSKIVWSKTMMEYLPLGCERELEEVKF